MFWGAKILSISNFKHDNALKVFKKYYLKFLVKGKKSYVNNSNKKKSLISVHICFNEVQEVRIYIY